MNRRSMALKFDGSIQSTFFAQSALIVSDFPFVESSLPACCNRFSSFLLFLCPPLSPSCLLLLPRCFQAALPRFLSTALVDDIAAKPTGVVTNVPGPTVPVHLCHSEVERILFWAPGMSKMGIVTSFFRSVPSRCC